MKFVWFVILSGILLAAPVNDAVEKNDSNQTLVTEKSIKEIKIGEQDRFEIAFNYEYIDPSDTYGSWKNINISYYQKYSEELTLVYQAGLFNRKEGSASLFALGAYKDWTPSFYTFSQLSVGTDSDYLPKYRLDNDFNFKFGEQKQWVGLVGFTYIDYYDIHTDFITSVGLTYYAPKYNISYRFFFNKSDPGSINSTTHLLSIGYGAEKESWTYFDISYGNQAYQSISDGSFANINEDALNLKLTHRHWLSENEGIFGSIGYFNLNDGYEKYLFQIGFFKEF